MLNASHVKLESLSFIIRLFSLNNNRSNHQVLQLPHTVLHNHPESISSIIYTIYCPLANGWYCHATPYPQLQKTLNTLFTMLL